jgi:transmembrane sensor
VAWKEGYFYFDKDNVKIIMRQVARWYNLSITYEGKAPEDLFSGKIERRLPLSGILGLLERGAYTLPVRVE